MDALNSLIGSTLIIISKKHIRYEGILDYIDCQNASVALRDVKCFGTENRVTSESEIVLSDSTVHRYVLFNGPDIADLQILKRTVSQPKPTSPLSVDPAVITVQSNPPTYQQKTGQQFQQPIQPPPSTQLPQYQTAQQVGIEQQPFQPPVEFGQQPQPKSNEFEQQAQKPQVQQQQPQQQLEEPLKQQQQGRQLKQNYNLYDEETEQQQHYNNNHYNNNNHHQKQNQPQRFQQLRKVQYRKKEQNQKELEFPSEQKQSNEKNHQQQQQQQHRQQQQQHRQQQQQSNSEQVSALPGSGIHLLKLREMNHQGMNEQIKANFDFETSFKNFEKLSNSNANENDSDVKNSSSNQKKKVKDTFFDDFSFDNQVSNDKYFGRKEKELNIETFGAAGLSTNGSYRGRRNNGNYNRNYNGNGVYYDNDQSRGRGRGRGRGYTHGYGRGRGGGGQWQRQYDDDNNKNMNHTYSNRGGNNYRYRQLNNNNNNTTNEEKRNNSSSN